MKNTFHIFDQSQFPYFTDIDLIVGESSTGDIQNSYKLLKENNIYILRPGQGHSAPFFSVKMAEFSEANEMKASLFEELITLENEMRFLRQNYSKSYR